MAGEYNYLGISRLSTHLYTDGEKFYVLAPEADLSETRSLVGALQTGDVAVELPQDVINYFREKFKEEEKERQLDSVARRFELYSQSIR